MPLPHSTLVPIWMCPIWPCLMMMAAIYRTLARTTPTASRPTEATPGFVGRHFTTDHRYNILSTHELSQSPPAASRISGSALNTTRPANGRDNRDRQKPPAQKRGHAHGLHRRRRLHHERPRRLRGIGVRDVAVGGVVAALESGLWAPRPSFRSERLDRSLRGPAAAR